jgi:hypothetical protein
MAFLTQHAATSSLTKEYTILEFEPSIPGSFTLPGAPGAITACIYKNKKKFPVSLFDPGSDVFRGASLMATGRSAALQFK